MRAAGRPPARPAEGARAMTIERPKRGGEV